VPRLDIPTRCPVGYGIVYQLFSEESKKVKDMEGGLPKVDKSAHYNTFCSPSKSAFIEILASHWNCGAL
jgi:hypothetical protein